MQFSCNIFTNSFCEKHPNVLWSNSAETILNSKCKICVKFLSLFFFMLYLRYFLHLIPQANFWRWLCIQTAKMYNKIFISREEVQDFFRTMDRDFDQKLTFAEFMGEESHIEKLFKSMDKNNDGFVTKKVYKLIWNHEKPQIFVTKKVDKVIRNHEKHQLCVYCCSNWNFMYRCWIFSFSLVWIKPLSFFISVNFQEFNDVCQNLSKEQVLSWHFSHLFFLKSVLNLLDIIWNTIIGLLFLFERDFEIKCFQVEMAFEKFDTSGDDRLNYKEFCLMIIKREQERW